jgi:hypothetical protein
MNIFILAASAMLAWNPNSEPDLLGYKLHVGIQPLTPGNPPVQSIDVGNVTQYQVDGLDYGTRYFFVATSYNPAGESAYSNEVTCTPIPPVEDQIKYWPRLNCNGRLNGGRFEAAPTKDGPWTIIGWSKWWPSYAGETIVLPSGTLAPFKAFRYVGAQWGTVAEIEFIQSGTKIAGTVFGTPGAWSYPAWINGTATVDKAFDGNTSTYWDAPTWSGTNHAGIERP